MTSVPTRNFYRSFPPSRAVWLLLAALVYAAGCASPIPVPVRVGVPEGPEPILPQQFVNDFNFQAPNDAGPLDRMMMFYMDTGRDFRPPVGLDGYLVQIVPLDKKNHPFRISRAIVTIGLYSNEPNAPIPPENAPPLRLWQVISPQLDRYWTTATLLNGYSLPLAWGETPLPPGQYYINVQVSYQTGGEWRNHAGQLTFIDTRGETPKIQTSH